MILEGTTSSGAVVPVQVTGDGKVVALGEAGPQGPEGPEGPQGPQGPAGGGATDEQGGWTPSLVATEGVWASAGAISFSGADWTRVGSLVFLRGELATTNRVTPNSASDYVALEGLPFPAKTLSSAVTALTTGAGMDGRCIGYVTPSRINLRYWSSTLGLTSAVFSAVYEI